MSLVNLQPGYLLRVFDFRTLYFILYYYLHIIFYFGFLYHIMSYHVGQMYIIILLYLLINIILHFKYQYRFLGPV
jgi:hypothetical protein